MTRRCICILATLCFTCISFAQIPFSPSPGNHKKIILGFTDTLKSEVLSETRLLNIYLPEGYSPDSAINYPVIYLLDGGVDEDFIHVTGLVRYFTTPWIDQFPGSIVVGIENVNRRRDFTFNTPNLDFIPKMGFEKSDFPNPGGSGKFISFIENELQPFINTHYKTNNSKTIIGESLGGLLATEILLKKPSMFDTYIIISPSLWWGSESLLKEPSVLSATDLSSNLKIYVGASNKKEDLVMFKDAKHLALLLKNYKSPYITVHFDYLADETHTTISHHAIYNAFKLLYPKASN